MQIQALSLRVAMFVVAFFALSTWASAQSDAETTRPVWQPTSGSISIASRHSVPGMNEVNPGLGLGWGAGPSGLRLGFFENSHSRGNNAAGDQRRYTVYATYRLSTDIYPVGSLGGISAAFDPGITYGYKKCERTGAPETCRTVVMPALIPSVAIHRGQHALRLSVIPTIKQSAGSCESTLSIAQGKKPSDICAVTLVYEHRF